MSQILQSNGFILQGKDDHTPLCVSDIQPLVKGDNTELLYQAMKLKKNELIIET